jgi:hypothetical protein
MRNILTTVPGKKEKRPLSVTHPELAKEADGWDPAVYLKLNLKMSWRCNLAHVYESVITERIRGKGCPYCAGRKVWKGFNDLATTHPELSKQAHGWDPQEVTAGSHSNREWICSKGHITKSIIKNRTQLGNRCSICANQVVLRGFNDLGTNYPEISAEAFGWNPYTVISGSKKRRNWKCPLGHIYENSPGARIVGQGCSICAGKKILIGFNDLATTNPEIATEAFGWDPQNVFRGTHSVKAFKCSNGHKYNAIVKDRTVKSSGCPTCAKTGFNPSLDAYLYFLKQAKWQMLQIGITNFPDDRLKEHKKTGWEVIELRGPMDGHLTHQWETAILRMLKAKGADLSNSKIAGKFDGYSEAWSKSTFEVKSIKELMRLTEEFEAT